MNAFLADIGLRTQESFAHPTLLKGSLQTTNMVRSRKCLYLCVCSQTSRERKVRELRGMKRLGTDGDETEAGMEKYMQPM